ncbi:MAG: FAD-dependent oxidoreductase [Luminiphilus sp.]|nr:FAD-dependent oxidoreductase [Luminiphilus sp.]
MANLSRREILVASASLPLWRTGTTRADPSVHYDVIVIGGGTAGIPCALFAAQAGARVLLIEKSPALGGTLYWSTGQIAGARTVFQQRLGIEDSPEAHFEDCMRINEHTADSDLTKLTVDHAGETINWLAARGFEVMQGHPVTGIGHDHFSTRRYQQGVNSGLSILHAFMPSLETCIARQQVTLLTGTSVTGLMQDQSGRVTGVTATGPSGAADIRGASVVLAAGGCAANPRLFEELHGVPLYARTAYPTSQGDGLLLGMSAGGAIVGGNKYASLPGLIPDAFQYPCQMYAWAPLNPALRNPWEILVNAAGNRFIREDHPSIHQIERGIYRQPGHRHWAVFDTAALESGDPIIPDWSRERLAHEHQSHPMFSSAMTVKELAFRAGLNPSALAETVDQYNRQIKSAVSDHLGRVHRPAPLATPPFYAIAMQGWTLVSFAGLSVNRQLQVLDNEKSAIPGLFAIGEIIGAAATSGAAYTNGMLVTPAITFGRILGKRLARI